jgi:hypothetical protein
MRLHADRRNTVAVRYERLLKKSLLTADGRGFRTASICFCVHQRSSAANLVFAFFRTLVCMRTGRQLVNRLSSVTDNS